MILVGFRLDSDSIWAGFGLDFDSIRLDFDSIRLDFGSIRALVALTAL